jgi:hypothetical protein
MAQSRLRTVEEIREDQLRQNPAFRAYWKRTALARAVALAVIAYRVEHLLVIVAWLAKDATLATHLSHHASTGGRGDLHSPAARQQLAMRPRLLPSYHTDPAPVAADWGAIESPQADRAASRPGTGWQLVHGHHRRKTGGCSPRTPRVSAGRPYDRGWAGGVEDGGWADGDEDGWWGSTVSSPRNGQ